MRDRTPEGIMRSNECNTYVMSCHINRDDLYISMREDISTMCAESLRAAIANAENDS